MRLVAHLQISIGDDGKLQISSLGYSLLDRGSRKPIDNAEVQALVAAFETSTGGSHVPGESEVLAVELTGETRPAVAPGIVPGQAPAASTTAAAERLLSSLLELGVDREAAQEGLRTKGAQRVAEIAGWLKRKSSQEELRAPTRLFESLLAR